MGSAEYRQFGGKNIVVPPNGEAPKSELFKWAITVATRTVENPEESREDSRSILFTDPQDEDLGVLPPNVDSTSTVARVSALVDTLNTEVRRLGFESFDGQIRQAEIEAHMSLYAAQYLKKIKAFIEIASEYKNYSIVNPGNEIQEELNKRYHSIKEILDGYTKMLMDYDILDIVVKRCESILLSQEAN